MAATVANRSEYSPAIVGTTLVPTFTQTTGDLVVIFVSLAVAGTITPGNGFTNLTNINANFHVIYKVLDGSEGGSVSITTPSSKGCCLAYNIQGFALTPAISTVATGTSTAPNATTVTPAGGSMDYLWISAFYSAGEEADDDTWCTAAPTNFTNLIQKTTGTAGMASTNSSIAAANYSSTAASMDAGAFTMAQSLAWRAYTIAITPSNPINITPGLGSADLTGFAPTFSATANKNISAGVGAIDLTGLAPTVQTPRNISANVGSITLTGLEPTVFASNNKNIQTDIGVITLTGFSSIISATNNKVILPDYGLISFTGYEPTVNASISSGIEVTANFGSIVLMGYEPIIQTPRNVTTELGEIQLTGFSPTIQTPINLLPNYGVFLIEGFASTVTVTQNTLVRPLTSQLDIIGFEPIVFATNHITISTSTGILNIIGHNPRIISQPVISISITDIKDEVLIEVIQMAYNKAISITQTTLTTNIEVTEVMPTMSINVVESMANVIIEI